MHIPGTRVEVNKIKAYSLKKKLEIGVKRKQTTTTTKNIKNKVSNKSSLF